MIITDFGHGAVIFIRDTPAAQPVVSQTSGNVTVNLIDDRKPRPPHLQVRFAIGFTHVSAGVTLAETIALSIAAPPVAADRTYAEIEEAAARQLPDVLRSLAVAVERSLLQPAPPQP
jgi:hypothetical protein